uniref:Uncharacterized protein n=1 Tax=Pyrodinium bahamense TaxID=73915 RepID=A0A7S0AE32_9DINO|mmetsp:Transcript_32098/g.88477  ORF Transcript_32098/g.88477 Transcript_32098/m.88477 type:complete len:371 (+) Transcript_32098:57-1169(+)
MVWWAALLALLGAVARAAGPAEPPGFLVERALALAADNECLSDASVPPGLGDMSISTPTGQRPATCAVNALQATGRHAARVSSHNVQVQGQGHLSGGEEMPQKAHLHREWLPERHQAEGGLHSVSAAANGNTSQNWSTLAAQLGTGGALDDMLLKLLRDDIPTINEAIHSAIPGVMENAYNTSLERNACCAPTPWGCWCHCTLSGTVYLASLSNANSLQLTDVTNVTSRIADGMYTVHAEAGVTDLMVEGTANGTATSCMLGPTDISGRLSFMASMKIIAELAGSLVPAQGGGICFKITEVKSQIPGSGVEYKRIMVSVGSWTILEVTSHFWAQVVNSMPTNFMARAITRVAEPALKSILAKREDLCFGT